jgi:hypothetical protein
MGTVRLRKFLLEVSMYPLARSLDVTFCSSSTVSLRSRFIGLFLVGDFFGFLLELFGASWAVDYSIKVLGEI